MHRVPADVDRIVTRALPHAYRGPMSASPSRPAASPRTVLGAVGLGAFVVFLYFLISALAEMLVVDALGVEARGAQGFAHNVISLVVGCALVVGRLGREEAAALFARWSPRDRALVAGGVLATAALYQVVELATTRLAPDLPPQARGLMIVAESGFPFFAAVVGLTLLDPLVEELLFRGYLVGAIVRRAGAATAVVVSSVSFMLIHEEIAWGLALCAGALWGVLRVRTGSMLPGLLAHVVANGVAVLFLLVERAAAG